MAVSVDLPNLVILPPLPARRAIEVTGANPAKRKGEREREASLFQGVENNDNYRGKQLDANPLANLKTYHVA